jgi:hypothetical protein
MYLRHTTRVKDGKTHTYWRLVRSVRHGRKVRQETVAQLGELDAEGRAKARALARHITGRSGEQGGLFAPWPPQAESVPVRLDQVRVENGRSFGAVWLGWVLWRALGLDTLCEERLAAGRAGVPWARITAVLVIARLCEPSSELHVAEDWYRRTALVDLLGIAPERLYEERLYRALDHLLPHDAEEAWNDARAAKALFGGAASNTRRRAHRETRRAIRPRRQARQTRRTDRYRPWPGPRAPSERDGRSQDSRAASRNA